jgi:hypothetical protein
MKQCTTCKIEKPLINFCVNKSKKDGFNDICKSCKKEYNKKYREINKESEIKRLKKWREDNTEKVKTYNSTIKQKQNEHKRNRRKDPLVKLYGCLLGGINASLKSKGCRKRYKSEIILGCSIADFKVYIESKFTEGMTWENHSKYGWHLDHIIPKSSAKTEKEVYELNHYTNFQPLWWQENLKKHNKLI